MPKGGSRRQYSRIAGQPHVLPSEEGTELTGFSPYRVHLLLFGVYIDHSHHNNGAYLDMGMAEYDI